MINTEKMFYGKQEGEKILYVARPHYLTRIINLSKVFIVALVICLAFLFLGKEIFLISNTFNVLGVAIPIAIIFVGSKIVSNFHSKNISYITDRRIVRFEPTTFFATNIRSLSWDEAVKVKTFSPNMLWKQLKLGTIIVHARTTVKTIDQELNNSIAADDIQIDDVYLYRDLGNYIDKILFTYKQMPSGVAEIRPFVEKPTGQRY